MIIPINISTPGSSSNATLPPQFAQFGSDEIVLIELQGSLEVEGNRDGQTVGKLTVDNVTKKTTLLIGYHLLEGKLVDLPKPLAVLRRPTHQPSNTDDDPMANESLEAKQEQRGWDMAAIVKRKMVFSKRPMPMVGRPTMPVTSTDTNR